MKEQNNKTKKFPVFEVIIICILIVIIMGTLAFMIPSFIDKDETSENTVSSEIMDEKSENDDKSSENESSDGEEISEEDKDENSEDNEQSAEQATGLEACMYGLSEEEKAKVQEIMSEMTLQEKIYQMMIVPPSTITGVSTVVEAGSGTQSALEQYPVGGLFYNATNMESQDQVSTMLSNTQSFCEIPVLTMCDEEGGTVARLMKTVGTTYIGSMLEYESQGPETARQNAMTIASDMSRLGFNLDLAPVADVWSNPSNTVIAERAYSTDFATAAQLIPAAVEGFHQGGVGCTLKHFPGHGDTAEDSHYSTAVVDKSLEELRANELLPFQAGIDAGADAVMMGHLTLPQIDEQPALFSYAVVTELLREEMGFEGVVMTDAMEMAAITDYYSSSDAAVKAISAGVDMLLGPASLTDSVSALENAVNDGTISEERIDYSVARILSLKVRRGIL